MDKIYEINVLKHLKICKTIIPERMETDELSPIVTLSFLTWKHFLDFILAEGSRLNELRRQVRVWG